MTTKYSTHSICFLCFRHDFHNIQLDIQRNMRIYTRLPNRIDDHVNALVMYAYVYMCVSHFESETSWPSRWLLSADNQDVFKTAF